jgi:Zn-dependent protease
MGLLWYAVLLLSLIVHEAAHALAALLGGDPTAYRGGQVSLDPRPHIRREPFGMVWVPLFFFASSGMMLGWASTPFDPTWAARHPRRAAWMALAGPAANLALFAVAVLGIHAGLAAGVFAAPATVGLSHVTDPTAQGFASWLATGLSILFSLNLLLCLFNLIPLPPLDGSGALPLFMSPAAGERYRRLLARPWVAIGGLLLAWFAIGPLFRSVHGLALRLLYPALHYG